MLNEEAVKSLPSEGVLGYTSEHREEATGKEVFPPLFL